MSGIGTSIGVALCTRNGERFIAEQLRSILGQVPIPTQLVISDDDSSDATVAAAQEVIADMDAAVPVRWIRNRPALGVTKNFEGAVRALAGCELIALSDQDDLWHDDKLADAAAVFERDRTALLVMTDARLVSAEGDDLGPSLFETLGVTEAELGRIEAGDAFGALLRRNLATGATVVFRSELLEDALPFPVSWVHDEWLAMVAATKGGVRVLRKKSIDYRQHGGNEIGVAEPTLGYKIRRMLQPRGLRNVELAAKFSELERWGRSRDLPPQLMASLSAKAAFERARAEMPETRIARVPAVARLAAKGMYSSYASQGRLDIVRDLLQAV